MVFLWVFVWAFLDKLVGLGHATAEEDAWLEGGSPTFGFLSFGAAGPFKGIYDDITGQGWAGWLFMIGSPASASPWSSPPRLGASASGEEGSHPAVNRPGTGHDRSRLARAGSGLFALWGLGV